MKTTIKLLGVALVVLVVGAGLATATGGFGPRIYAGDADRPANGPGPGDGIGPVADGDRPHDGRYSPWITGDDRLDRFQDRFDLTDAQMEQLRTDVVAMIEDGEDHDAIRAYVVTTLEAFDVENPALGPTADRQMGDGPRNAGPHGPADGGARQGGFGGTGPRGPADGGCIS